MDLISKMRRYGWLAFGLMWIPFTCIFAGMASEFGYIGRNMAEVVDGFFPGLMTAGGDDLSLFSMVSMVVMFGMMFVAMGLLIGSSVVAGLGNRRLLKSGKPAQAKIVSANQTGTYINDNPEVHFVLEVQPEGERPFSAEAQRVVPQIEIPQLQPGSLVNVRYDPRTLEVAIDN